MLEVEFSTTGDRQGGPQARLLPTQTDADRAVDHGSYLLPSMLAPGTTLALGIRFIAFQRAQYARQRPSRFHMAVVKGALQLVA